MNIVAPSPRRTTQGRTLLKNMQQTTLETSRLTQSAKEALGGKRGLDYRNEMDTEDDSTDSYCLERVADKKLKKRSPIIPTTTNQEQQQYEKVDLESAMPDNPNYRLKALNTKLKDTALRVRFSHQSEKIYEEGTTVQSVKIKSLFNQLNMFDLENSKEWVDQRKEDTRYLMQQGFGNAEITIQYKLNDRTQTRNLEHIEGATGNTQDF